MQEAFTGSHVASYNSSAEASSIKKVGSFA
jgi:hypothetical protein